VFMGAKISKAKRPKRRWIGISFSEGIQSRTALRSALSDWVFLDCDFKLYDAHFAGSQVGKSAKQHCSLEDDAGFAIVRVLLKDYESIRHRIKSAQNHTVQSHTSSGKLRLVRERMGLPKPQQR